MKLPSVALCALAACSAACSDGERLHRFEPTPHDLELLASGHYPVLILQDGAPCEGALFATEELWPTDMRLSEYGFRERIVSESEPSAVRADARGIVWYRPPAEAFVWQRRASAGMRIGSLPFTRSLCFDVEAAARAGILASVMELYELTTWQVSHVMAEGTSRDLVPCFLVDDRGVIQHLIRRSETEYVGLSWSEQRSQDPDFAPARLVAGYDLARGVEIPSRERRLKFDLADCGTIEVGLWDEAGNPATASHAVILEEHGSPRAAEWFTYWWGVSGSPGTRSQDGRALLVGVPPGRRWWVGATLLPGTAPIAVEVDGPTFPGEVVRVNLSARDGSVPIHARLADAEGLPLGHVAGSIRGRTASIPFLTDADGFLRVRIPHGMLAAHEKLVIASDYDPPRLQRRLEVASASLLGDASEHVWTWPENVEEFFASGMVVDERGLPVPFAELMALETGGGRADAHGEFRLDFAWEPQDSDEVEAFSPWHLPNAVKLLRGQRDVTLRLETGARIAGKLAEPWRGRTASVHYLRPGAAEAVEVWLGDWWSGEGEFEIGPIPVDAVEIRFDFGKAGTALLRGLPLAAGKVHRLAEPVRPQR